MWKGIKEGVEVGRTASVAGAISRDIVDKGKESKDAFVTCTASSGDHTATDRCKDMYLVIKLIQPF